MKLPELKKKFTNKYAIRIVAGVLTVALLGSGMTAVAVNADQNKNAEVKQETTVEDDKDTLQPSRISPHSLTSRT